VVYTSESLALATLELFVHVRLADAPDDLVAVAADIPDTVAVEEIVASGLPADWRAYPAPEALGALGTEWARAGRTAVLLVPSAIVPVERNVLLNPAHPAFRSILVGRPERFAFDKRLGKRKA